MRKMNKAATIDAIAARINTEAKRTGGFTMPTIQRARMDVASGDSVYVTFEQPSAIKRAMCAGDAEIEADATADAGFRTFGSYTAACNDIEHAARVLDDTTGAVKGRIERTGPYEWIVLDNGMRIRVC